MNDNTNVCSNQANKTQTLPKPSKEGLAFIQFVCGLFGHWTGSSFEGFFVPLRKPEQIV